MIQLAELAASFAPPSWGSLLILPLTFLIYVLLSPAVYLTILLFGIELALPKGTPARALVRRRGEVSPVKIALANDPTTRILSVVAGLLALAFWSTVVTFWLSGYLRDLPAPSLAASQASTSHAVIFSIAFFAGLVGGILWTNGVRTAATARASLGVLSLSMSLSGTLLFFYIVEPSVRDVLLVVSLGVFTGELAVAARHPMLMREGLFDVLRSPLEPETDDDTELSDMTDDDDDDSGRSARTGGWVTAQTRAIRERLSAQTLAGIGGPHPEPPPTRPTSGDLHPPRGGTPAQPG
jgi:hypothetical protein